jgi:hypothetical protein
MPLGAHAVLDPHQGGRVLGLGKRPFGSVESVGQYGFVPYGAHAVQFDWPAQWRANRFVVI